MRISMRKRKCEIVMSRLDEPCVWLDSRPFVSSSNKRQDRLELDRTGRKLEPRFALVRFDRIDDQQLDFYRYRNEPTIT